MDPIKEAFKRAKQDISELKSQLSQLNQEISSLKVQLSKTDKPTDRQTDPSKNQTISIESQTTQNTRAENYPLEGLKNPNSNISTGNRGVQTDRQTNQQTDRQITAKGSEYQLTELSSSLDKKPDKIQELQKITEILGSLDQVKKDLRLKFKHITPQELLVFSTIYQLENKGLIIDYSLISQHLSLSESAIRDYVQKLIKKGIPIEKTKENNKKIILKISENLKKIASLNTILELRKL
jgi:hypothetical protein